MVAVAVIETAENPLTAVSSGFWLIAEWKEHERSINRECLELDGDAAFGDVPTSSDSRIMIFGAVLLRDRHAVIGFLTGHIQLLCENSRYPPYHNNPCTDGVYLGTVAH